MVKYCFRGTNITHNVHGKPSPKLFINVPLEEHLHGQKGKRMKHKELRAWVFLALLQLTWVVPICISEAQKTPAEEIEMITEWEDVIRWRIDEADVSIEGIETVFVEKAEEETIKNKSLGFFKLTAYCPCKSCSDNWGTQTSTGATATEGRTVAVDPKVIPYGTTLIINGIEYIAEDCGGAIKGNKIDIYFESHKKALEFGIQYTEIFVKEMN